MAFATPNTLVQIKDLSVYNLKKKMWIYYRPWIFLISIRINEKELSITILNLFDNFVTNRIFQMHKNIKIMFKKYVKIII